jgi:2-polyprenyl-3-methyl-5-hydroxy-6-metoxy-1,4-benzoquinol methylase
MTNNKFDDLAKQWDSFPQRVKGAMRFVDNIKKYLPDDIADFDLLDYGCGTGLVSFGFSSDVNTIQGFDNSSSMVDVYNDKAKQIGMQNISAKLHDINTQTIPKDKFDLIVTNMTMHHINDTDDFICKLVDGLKENSYLCIADLKTEDGTFHQDNKGVIYFGFEVEDIKRIFEKYNLKNIQIDLLETINKDDKSYEVFSIIGCK